MSSNYFDSHGRFRYQHRQNHWRRHNLTRPIVPVSIMGVMCFWPLVDPPKHPTPGLLGPPRRASDPLRFRVVLSRKWLWKPLSSTRWRTRHRHSIYHSVLDLIFQCEEPFWFPKCAETQQLRRPLFMLGDLWATRIYEITGWLLFLFILSFDLTIRKLFYFRIILTPRILKNPPVFE